MPPGCSAADSGPQPHAADADEEAENRSRLSQEVRAQVQFFAAQTGVSDLDPALVRAMAEVPRHAFVPPPLRPFAYIDMPLPVSPEQNTAQPFLIALMTQLADVQPDDIVYETGTGAGYHAAILSRLGRKVYSVEIIRPLAEKARDTLRDLGYANVEVNASDGFFGWPEKGPFDVIIVKEAVREIPAPLLNQLKTGGRLVAPVGPLDQSQTLKLVTKDASGRIRQRDVLPVRFSPLQGGERI